MSAQEPVEPERVGHAVPDDRPPQVQAGTLLVGCLTLIVFAVIAVIVLSVVGGTANALS